MSGRQRPRLSTTFQDSLSNFTLPDNVIVCHGDLDGVFNRRGLAIGSPPARPAADWRREARSRSASMAFSSAGDLTVERGSSGVANTGISVGSLLGRVALTKSGGLAGSAMSPMDLPSESKSEPS